MRRHLKILFLSNCLFIMISIVVCSASPKMLNKFKENIALTVDSVYEIIAFDNTILKKSICTIYNMGTLVAKYDIIAYCHEDIIFNTNDWALELKQLLNDKTIGLVGALGTIYKSKYPTSWATIPSQYYRPKLFESLKKSIVTSNNQAKFSKVVVLDGHFIAGRKKIFQHFLWNENFLKGFHMYDIDLCLHVGNYFSIVVSNVIKIKHLSDGNMDENWLCESKAYHKHYRANFPLNNENIGSSETKVLDYHSLFNYFFITSSFNRPVLERLNIILKAFWLLPLKKDNLRMIKYLLKNI